MKINANKTKFMVFKTCKTIDILPTASINGEEINLAEEMKILGVMITSYLRCFKSDFDAVKSKFGLLIEFV